MEKLDIILLVHSALGGQSLPADVFSNYTVEDWRQLLEFSSQQGVLAVLFPAFEMSDIRPPIEELMMWYGKSELIKSFYSNHIAGARKLARLLESCGCEAMVMKGVSLAPYYPDPATREFGDLDVYTFANHENLNDCIRSMGIGIEPGLTHDEFNYGGVHVEHHNRFVSSYSDVSRKVNDYLLQVVTSNKGTLVGGLYYPCPDFNAVYMVRHTSKHFTGEGVTLRHILDWGFFLRKDGVNVNWAKTIAFLRDNKMVVAFNTLTVVAEMVIGFDLSQYYIGSPDRKLAVRALKEILNTALHAEVGYSTISRLFMKSKRILSHRWMYSSGLIPDHFWREFIWWTAKVHITDTNQI